MPAPGLVGGTVNVTPSGGTAPYTYAWVRSSGTRSTISNTTSSNPSINANLVANDNFTESWTVTVKDSTQVSTTASVTVNFKVTVPTLTASINPNPLNITSSATGYMGGTVNVNASGGLAPYTYAWVRNSGTASNISNATSSSPTISATLNTAGQSLTESWTVTVKDSINTSTTASVTANFTVNSIPLLASVSPATVNLNTTEAGTISSTVTATPSGGVAPYRYQWSRTVGTRSAISSSTISAPSISAAVVANDNFSETWNVVITDANNVTSNANVIVNFKVTASGVAVVRYSHTDGLGSPVAKSDANGNLIAGSRTRYEPYGMAVAGTAVPTIGFTGHVNDADTGLTYMQQRYYDPVAGRFLSTDPVLTDSNNGASFNRYTYALNNPYKYIDQDGRESGSFYGTNPSNKMAAPCAGDAQCARGGLIGIGSIFGMSYGIQGVQIAGQIINNVLDAVEGSSGYLRAGVEGNVRTNLLTPIKEAEGAHTTWKTDHKTGEISRHETWKPNAKNPTGFDSVQSTDLKGAPHVNKKTAMPVPTPHTQGKNIPGGVRPALPIEIPKRIK